MIKPQGYRILVKPDPVENRSKGGIIMAIDEKLEKGGIQRGVLIDFGPLAWKAHDVNFSGKPWANRGDYVYFARFAGKFVQDPADPDQEYLIMNDEDLLAIITDDESEDYINKTQQKLIGE